MAISTTAAVLGAAAIGVAGSLAAGAMGSAAAKEAAKTEAGAAVYAADLQNLQYQQNREDMMPWLESGRTALRSYMGEMGLSDEAKAGTFKSGFTTTPGYDFSVAEGEKGVVNNLAALGMKGSGAALKALTRFRQGLATQTHDNYLTRLSNMATGGQQATQNMANMGTENAIGVGNALRDGASARASGYIGSANAWGNALSGMSNTAGNALGWLSGNKGWAT